MSDSDDDVVIVGLAGQLGNQLFCYAAGRTLAGRLDVPLRMLPNGRGKMLRRCIGPAFQPASSAELRRQGIVLSRYLTRPSLTLLRAREGVRRRVGASPHLLEAADPRGYDQTFEDLVAPCHLRGYLQHPRYYEPTLHEVCDLIIDELAIAPPDAGPAIVGVHFRRGDFVGLGWALGLDYYEAALAVVLAEVPDAAIRVFSDDQVFATLVEEHFAGRGLLIDRTPTPTTHGEPTIDGLVALARCAHLVTANSTYSWWGATIGDRLQGPADRVVVCPTIWDLGRPAPDQVRPGWHPVDTSESFAPAPRSSGS